MQLKVAVNKEAYAEEVREREREKEAFTRAAPFHADVISHYHRRA